jgi:hypothetical protein
VIKIADERGNVGKANCPVVGSCAVVGHPVSLARTGESTGEDFYGAEGWLALGVIDIEIPNKWLTYLRHSPRWSLPTL